jgi:hypothetical protein
MYPQDVWYVFDKFRQGAGRENTGPGKDVFLRRRRRRRGNKQKNKNK